MYEFLDFNTTRGSQKDKPLEIDTTSSRFYTYIRKNIEWIKEEREIMNTEEITDEEGNVIDHNYIPTGEYETIFEGWQYDEAKVLNPDYTVDELARQKAEIETLKEDNLILMGALTDIFEMMLS